MKAIWNNTVIAESDDTLPVEGNHYFPETALKREYVTFSNHKTSCPWKGHAKKRVRLDFSTIFGVKFQFIHGKNCKNKSANPHPQSASKSLGTISPASAKAG